MTLQAERESAIHMLRTGHSVKEVAQTLGRSERWVRKWRARFETEGWAGLRDRSRRPKRLARALPESHRQAILRARSALEAEAARGDGLKYIGAQAVRTRLKEQGLEPLPSTATIERVLRAAGMTRPRRRPPQRSKTVYPRLRPQQPQTLIQVDIVPHFLRGGQQVACFNALDVVSRYPTGKAMAHRRSQDAEAFLLACWEDLGTPQYTQVDNEACFSGGATHPYVLGRVVRLALAVGTELVFSPQRHPESNGYVERFHQDDNRHVWQDTYLPNREAVDRQAAAFFERYRRRPHPQLQERTPAEVHGTPQRRPTGFGVAEKKRPLYEGKVHFIRKVKPDGTISVLNVDWKVSQEMAGRGVWATLVLRPEGAWLRVYDAAPDVPRRRLLVTHPFRLSEPVLPRPKPSSPAPAAAEPPRPAPGTHSFRNDVLRVVSAVKDLFSGTMS